MSHRPLPFTGHLEPTRRPDTREASAPVWLKWTVSVAAAVVLGGAALMAYRLDAADAAQRDAWNRWRNDMQVRACLAAGGIPLFAGYDYARSETLH